MVCLLLLSTGCLCTLVAQQTRSQTGARNGPSDRSSPTAEISELRLQLVHLSVQIHELLLALIARLIRVALPRWLWPPLPAHALHLLLKLFAASVVAGSRQLCLLLVGDTDSFAGERSRRRRFIGPEQPSGVREARDVHEVVGQESFEQLQQLVVLSLFLQLLRLLLSLSRRMHRVSGVVLAIVFPLRK